MSNFFLLDLNYYNFYFFSLILLNIFIYIFLLINIFLILFIFDIKYVKTLSDLKILNNVSFIYISTVIIFLSLAGIPPLAGFIGKFLIFIYIFYKANVFIFLLFIFVNMFIIYFYLQNLRFLVSKTSTNKFYYNYNRAYLNSTCIKYINLFNFFNIFLMLYLEEFIIFFNYITLSLFF